MSENARKVFAKNLQRYLDANQKTQADLVQDLDFKQSTVSDWLNGKKYPRIDKVEALAEYFSVLKSDLTEEKPSAEAGEDKELVEILEHYKNRPELKILFSVTKNASPESIKRAAAIVEALEKDEQDDE